MKDSFIYGKRALVTGATSGIGKSIARALASLGYTVYGVSRSAIEEEETIGKGRLILRKMDVTDSSSIEKVVNEIGEFAILIDAAGFGIGGSAEDSDIELVKALFDTNYFGLLRLVKIAGPVLRKQKRSIVIAISSFAARVPLPYQSHYSSTKYALEAYLEALRMEAKSFSMMTALVEPGDLSTGFTSKRKCAIDSSSPYYPSYLKALSIIEKDEKNGGGPIIIARAVEKILKKKKPRVRTVCGINYRFLAFLLRFMPDKLVLYVLSKMYGLES